MDFKRAVQTVADITFTFHISVEQSHYTLDVVSKMIPVLQFELAGIDIIVSTVEAGLRGDLAVFVADANQCVMPIQLFC